jgi:hypothetical protein
VSLLTAIAEHSVAGLNAVPKHCCYRRQCIDLNLSVAERVAFA